MNYSIQESGSEVVINLDGHLNFAASKDFKRLITDLGKVKDRPVVFDLTKVPYIDSVGLGLLYIAKEEFGTAGRRLSLRAPGEAVRKMLRLTEAEAEFDIR